MSAYVLIERHYFTVVSNFIDWPNNEIACQSRWKFFGDFTNLRKIQDHHLFPKRTNSISCGREPHRIKGDAMAAAGENKITRDKKSTEK